LRGAQSAADLRHKLALLDIEAQHRLALYRSHFNPNQPRVPAGHPDGGQWTSAGSGGVDVRGFDEHGISIVGPLVGSVQSDASPDPTNAGSQYAQNGPNPSGPDPAIERTKSTLFDILVAVNASVAATVAKLPNPISARLYGVLVHAEFARVVRARNLPGIGSKGVEQSFDMDGLTHYGADGSIRTDVILRNERQQIIAVFDVKTGNATMGPPREAKIRSYTKVGPDVPMFILRAIRPDPKVNGPERK
jgi:hypothetical protein